MSKQTLFDEDSEEEEASFKIENEYAKKYDRWREKEELHKLEQKYGSKPLSSDVSVSSDSEDESDEPPDVSEEVETQFLKTLALLKTKDPRIYDPNYKFFEEKEENKEEKANIVKSLVFEDSDDDGSDDGNIFTVEKKAEIAAKKPDHTKNVKTEKSEKDSKIKEFLTGKAEHIDETVEKDLAPLKALWSDPKLNEGEAFLRDYILNKRYLDSGDVGQVEDRLRDDEDLEEDERRVEEQGQFERAYNFRFEEPDTEYLKRYPRTMNYTRPKDDSRSRKRAEVRSRKEEEKKRKMEEIARMKALKLKEIHEKIAKIKEVTGNEELAFKDEDIEGDFDPAEHDRRMKALFDEEFYGGVDDQKPVFPDLDEELEIENWETYEPEIEKEDEQEKQDGDGPYCEDEDFNMDADYDPKQARTNLLEQIQASLGKKRRVRKKKSKLAQLLAADKPKFVPTVADKTYEQYMEEYYKMDCEDVIGGDLPTRFKYRQVLPNDYGLTVEEILLADDKELTQWVPLKKIVRHRPADVEKSEVRNYQQKAADQRLKKKILPSLFKDLPEEPEIVVPIEEATKKKKKKKKKIKEKQTEVQVEETAIENEPNAVDNTLLSGETVAEVSTEVKKKKKKRKKSRGEQTEGQVEETTNENQPNAVNNTQHNIEMVIEGSTEVQKKKNKKKQNKQNIENKDSNVEIFTDVNVINSQTLHTEIHNESKVILNDGNREGKRKKKKRKRESNIEDEVERSLEVSHEKKKKLNNHEETINTGKNTEDIRVSKIYESKQELSENPGIKGEVNRKRKKKKKHKTEGFVVENVQDDKPSQKGHEENKNATQGENRQKINKKRKASQPGQGPDKKKKFVFAKGNTGFRNKFKSKDTSSDNPLSGLSDERLKAYGLNPKKYRSFLKYKKF